MQFGGSRETFQRVDNSQVDGDLATVMETNTSEIRTNHKSVLFAKQVAKNISENNGDRITFLGLTGLLSL